MFKCEMYVYELNESVLAKDRVVLCQGRGSSGSAMLYDEMQPSLEVCCSVLLFTLFQVSPTSKSFQQRSRIPPLPIHPFDQDLVDLAP
jgi:hypothetical protein